MRKVEFTKEELRQQAENEIKSLEKALQKVKQENNTAKIKHIESLLKLYKSYVR